MEIEFKDVTVSGEPGINFVNVGDTNDSGTYWADNTHYYHPYDEYPYGNYPKTMEDEISQIFIGTIMKDRVIDAQEEEEHKNMEKLFEVFVVTNERKVILDGKRVVAENEDDAKFQAEVDSVLRENELTHKEVTVICRNLGNVKIKEEPEKVKIVED